MKTYKILFEAHGENYGTPKSPIAIFAGQVNLEETHTVCRSWDDDGLTTEKKYAVKDITLPDWLSPEEWMRSYTTWEWIWVHYSESQTFPESWQRFLTSAGIHGATRLAIYTLLKTKKFRSEFRQSLRNQLEEWIDTPPEDRNHEFPFSQKQMEYLVSQRDVWQTQNHTLRNHEACGVSV